MKKIPIRHGDIGFVPSDGMKGEVIEHKGEFVVGYGETTGHTHRLSVRNKEDLIIRKDSNGDYYFELLKEGTLVHEEHKTLIVPPGIYRKFQEEEVDHFAGSVMRKVID